MIARIRKGNDFHVAWQIKRGGVAENLENATDIKLERTIYGVTTEHTLFTVSGDTITAEIPAEVQTHYGQYKLTLSYELVDTGMSDDDRKCKVAIYAFAIVDPLGPADDLLTVDVASDVSIGFKGDEGLSAYQVWLENGNVGTEDDYFDYLRQPATDAASSVSELEGTVSDNEALRVTAEQDRVDAELLRVGAESARNDAEGLRDSAEDDRIAAEGIRDANETDRINAESDRVGAEDLREQAEVAREEAEGLRQTNTTTAIQNAGDATTAANTAAGLANSAATAANTAAGSANSAATAANTAAGLADTARTELTTAVNTKLGEADDKIEEMDTTLSTYDGRVTQVEADIDQLAGDMVQMAVDLKKTKDITGEIVSGEYFTSTGAIATYAGTKRTEKIPIALFNEVWVKANWTLPNLRIVFFSVTDTFISAVTHTGGILSKLTVPVGAAFVGVSADGANEIYVEGRSDYGGAEIAESINVTKNLSSKLTIEEILPQNAGYYYHKDTGVYSPIANYVASDKISILDGSKLLLNGSLGATNGCCIGFWNSLGGFIPYAEKTSYDNELISPPTGAVEFAYSKISTDTLTVMRVGAIVAEDIPGIQEIADAGYTGAKSVNFYQLGEDYTSINTRTAAANYGIIFAGQSNMVGNSAFADLATLGLPTTLDVSKWDGFAMSNPFTLVSPQTWGVWWSILKRLKDHKPTTPIYSFNYSDGGKSLYTDFNVEKLGLLARGIAVRIHALKAYSTIVNIKCVVWIQGENDYMAPADAAYYQSLKNFIAFIRGAIGNPRIPFIIVGHHPECSRYSQIVRDAQVRVSEEEYYVHFVNPDSLAWTTIGDDLHYDGVYNEALAPLIFDLIKDL